MRGIVDVRRLAFAAFLLPALFLPVYVLLLEDESSDAIGSAVLLETLASSGQKVGLKPGEVAPNFEISTPDGDRVRLSEFRGRPVVVTFFALWCGSCLSEMPLLAEAQAERGTDNLVVLAVNAGESRSRALEFIDFLKAPFTYGLDFDLTVSDAYGARGLPYSVFVDAEGIVRAVYLGEAGEDRLGALIETAVSAGRPPTFPFALGPPVSGIPRDHVLTVEARASGRLVFVSRSLRCDATYCGSFVAEEVRKLSGVRAVETLTAKDGEPAIEVTFDASVLQQQSVVDAVVSALMLVPDPVYEAPLDVRFGGS